MYTGVVYRGLQKELRKLTYYDQINDIIEALAHEYRDEAAYQQLSVNMLLQLLPLLNTENISVNIPTSTHGSGIKWNTERNKSFTRYTTTSL